MKDLYHKQVLSDALREIAELLEGVPSPSQFKAARQVAQKALLATAAADPLKLAVHALARSVVVLEGELQEARRAQAAGEMWVCVETPARLEQARKAIAAAKAAGVVL